MYLFYCTTSNIHESQRDAIEIIEAASVAGWQDATVNNLADMM